MGTTRTVEARYYFLSRAVPAATLRAAVRSHRGIENHVHWVLDMSFHQDQRRVRDGYAAENLGVLRQLALNLLRQQPASNRLSLRARREQAGWDQNYLLQLLSYL